MKENFSAQLLDVAQVGLAANNWSAEMETWSPEPLVPMAPSSPLP